MTLEEQLENLSQMKADLDALRPIPKDALRELNEKLSLEWTFHSNKLEGNSLDFNETKLLINRGLTAKGKPMKDHRDIEGHQSVVESLETLVKRDELISLAELRDMHKLLLKEPYLADATTPGGEPTKRRIEIGQYKTVPNHVETRTGKIFKYTEPEYVNAEMIALWDWLKSEEEKLSANSDKATYAIVVATELHYRFVRIHPFDDGNGRLSRILMNYLLMRHGYFPAVIPIDARDPYFDALGVADETDDLTDLTQLIASSVESSMGWALKAARGESLREVGDLDKEIKILERVLDTKNDEKLKPKRTISRIRKHLREWIIPAVASAHLISMRFDKYFQNVEHSISSSLLVRKGYFSSFSINTIEEYLGEDREAVIKSLWKIFDKTATRTRDSIEDHVEYNYYFNHKASEEQQYIHLYFWFQEDQIVAGVTGNIDGGEDFILSYDQVLSEDRVALFVESYGRSFLSFLNSKLS